MTDWFNPLTIDPSLTVLPPQSLATPQAPDVSNAQLDKEAKFVPSSALKQFLMRSFEEPEVPSGIPNAKQQEMAGLHRGIGNATANAVNSLEGTANILRPGGGNTNAGDASRRYGEFLAQRALGDASARRQEAIQNVQLKDLSDQRREKFLQQALLLKQQSDMQDPSSQMSRQAQAREAQRIDLLLSNAQNPAMIAQLQQQKKMLPSVSASQISANEKSDPSLHLLGMDSNERAAGAKLAGENANRQSEAEKRVADIANANDARSAEWARIDLEKQRLAQEKELKEKSAAGKAKGDQLKLIGQQAPLVDEIGKLTQSMKQMEEAQKMLSSEGGKLDTNVVKEKLESAKQFIPGMTPDAKYLEFWGKVEPAVQQLRLAIEKTVRNNPYMMQQVANMLPHKGDNTQTIDTKITNLNKLLHQTVQSKISQLRVDPETGTAIDKSALAQHLAGETGIDADELLKNYLTPMKKNPNSDQKNPNSELPQGSAPAPPQVPGNVPAQKLLPPNKLQVVRALAAKGNKAAQKMLQDMGAQ